MLHDKKAVFCNSYSSFVEYMHPILIIFAAVIVLCFLFYCLNFPF